jgi:hypothetical protein
VRTEAFFDQVARTLAEPMPRRRAVRIIGVSLAAAAMPGIRPGRASATTNRTAACRYGRGTNPYQNVCDKNLRDRTVETYCCGPPKWRFECYSPDEGLCADRCPPKIKGPNGPIYQYPCTATAPDTQGEILGKCCVKPRDDGCAPDGECLPNCPYRFRFGLEQGPVRCGKTCCKTYQVCVDGECQRCEKYGGHTCQPPKGQARCCKKGTTCCFNETTTACCGPKQTCRAQNRKTATCECEEGKKCGPDCCEKDETCCGGKKCCAKGETCTPQGCCPKDRAKCVAADPRTPTVCCDEGEYCLWKFEDGLAPLIGWCKEGCAPGNKAGTQCCGTGYKPNRSKTGCVPA